MPTVERAILLIALAAGFTCTSACTRAGGKPTRERVVRASTMAHSITSTSRPPRSPEQEVADAYNRAVAAYLEAGTRPKHSSALLRETRTGENLRELQQRMADLAAHGVVFAPRTTRRPADITSVHLNSPVRATVTSCVVDDGLQVRERDGVVINTAVQSYAMWAQLKKERSRWRVATSVAVKTFVSRLACAR